MTTTGRDRLNMSDLRSIGFSEIRARLAGNRLTVYEALLQGGPATGSELAARLNWSVLSVRPRVVELVDMCHAQATGKRRDSEHEFRALTSYEAGSLHEKAAIRPLKDMTGPAFFIPPLAVGTGREIQTSLF